jgi:hypothetical protein
MLDNTTYPTCVKHVLEYISCKPYILGRYAHDRFYL